MADRGKKGMKIKAILPYFGGKRNMAATIVEQLGSHRVYWEPFCGSLAVIMAKSPCEMETVNDLNGDLINLAKVIQDRNLAPQLYDKLSRTLCAEQFFRESKERWISAEGSNGQPDMDRAYDFFVASWMGLNGASGTKRCNYQFALRWWAGGGHGAKRWMSVVESLPAWHQRLQNVLVIQRDAFGVLDNIKDDTGTAIYCDPPYFVSGSKYVHNFKDGDHERLAQALQRFKRTRVIVSYYDHPKLAALYKGWRKIHSAISAQSLRNTSGHNKSTKKRQVEVLLINGEDQKGLFE